jgi:hypothetical protein
MVGVGISDTIPRFRPNHPVREFYRVMTGGSSHG